MQKYIAYGGAAALVVGLFTPVMTIPVVGNVNLFANGQNIIGLSLLAFAAAGAGLALKDRDADLAWPGLASLIIVGYAFARIEWMLAQIRQSLSQGLAGNPFANLAQAASSAIQIQWGWLVLAAGAIALIYAGVASRKSAGRSALGVEDGVSRGVAAACILVCMLIVGWDVWTKFHVSQEASPKPETHTSTGLPADETTASEITPEESLYIARDIKIYDLRAKYYDSMLDGKIPGVDFKIKNLGDRTLNEVDVRVKFYDNQGRAVAEETYYPVLVTDSGFGENNKPLRPNYIWRNEPDKFYSAKSVPSEWKSGKVSAEIIKIEFAPKE